VSTQRICLVGATGLVGSRLIAQAAGRPDVRIIALARREVALPHGASVEFLLARPSQWPDAIAACDAHVLVCALGTTFGKAGRNEAAFRAVDYDLVIACARAAKAAGLDHMILVSAVGADVQSRTFYLRVKGETEKALAGLNLRRLDILRPALLRGPRVERRRAERLAVLLSPAIDVCLLGRLRRFRSIGADRLAQAILVLAGEKADGRFIHAYDELLRVIRGVGDNPHV
jgi:uncharacterized protein YbjT (DUF2867 family)